MTNEGKKSYSLFGTMALILSALILLIIFKAESLPIGIKYLLPFALIISVLIFTYSLVKLFFHTQARNSSEELNVKELPRDQEDVRKTH